MTTLAIIGSAGRRIDASRITLPLWNDMKRLIALFVKKHDFTSVISGGAAVADHLAVGLFNAGLVSSLTLALPCPFDLGRSCFQDDGSRDWKTNPGGTSNYYHRQFSRIIGRGTLGEIKMAIERGAKMRYERGFMARNSIVATADAMIAFTFGHENQVADGGTSDTCRKYLARGGKSLFHVDLNTMRLYENGILA